MNSSLRILISIIMMLLVILVLVVMYGSVEAEVVEARCPPVYRIELVIPEQLGQPPACNGIEGCVMACFMLQESLGNFVIDCFPWISTAPQPKEMP